MLKTEFENFNMYVQVFVIEIKEKNHNMLSFIMCLIL